ncbi:MAG: methionine--tRNA ligase [Candidatus Lokiarchaeota archaeon]|nr:methionine--tRNA ligase [Candidatus Lokiarchaeota archaeon]
MINLTDNHKGKWVVTSAWPYVNATPHLGNLIGSTLSADVFARFLRMNGEEVVFVSGSDSHGTPISIEAKKLNVPAEDLAFKYHKEIKDLHEKWMISFDNYTITHNPTHIELVKKIYLDVEKNGYVLQKEIESLYCENDNLFLPDRFVEGTCPNCKEDGARGDQCDKCQKLLTPVELIKPICAICGSVPVIKKTRHWYLDLPKLQDRLKKLIEENEIIPPNARKMCLNSITEGLPQRGITRDLQWGIGAPFKGAENKVIYVWLEAVLGYITAVKEWAEKIVNDPSKFDYFWKDPNTKTVFFIGKDNIIFHLILFPGLLIAYNEDKNDAEKFVLPYNVSSTEFLMMGSEKLSKSRGIGMGIDEALELAPLDYWRFYLLFNRPETSDTSFLWSEFENNMKTLNDNIGNFIHRTLTFIEKQFGSRIPEKTNSDDIDKKFIEKINNISQEVGESLINFKLRKAIRDIVNFGKEGNIYLNDKAPWHLIKKDKKAAGHVFNICAQAVYALAVLLGPFIPETSENILSYLNASKLADVEWDSITENSVKIGQNIKKPKPLFQKLEIEEIKNKYKKLKEEKPKKGGKDLISYEDFQKLDIRVALVEKVEKVPKADKLYKLSISLGTEKRTIVAGLAEYYKANELEGKKIIILANLEPRKLKGITSQGMLLAADFEDNVSILVPDKDIEPGANVR